MCVTYLGCGAFVVFFFLNPEVLNAVVGLDRENLFSGGLGAGKKNNNEVKVEFSSAAG